MFTLIIIGIFVPCSVRMTESAGIFFIRQNKKAAKEENKRKTKQKKKKKNKSQTQK